MDKKLTGHCLCGACEVIIRPAEGKMHACHCDMCRAWTGSSLMAVKVLPGDLEAKGTGSDPRDFCLGGEGMVR